MDWSEEGDFDRRKDEEESDWEDEEESDWEEDWEDEEIDWEGMGLGALGRSALRVARRKSLDTIERWLWLDLWRAPVLDAIEEQGVETRFYGPIQATVAAAMPKEELLNLLLGAGEEGAVQDGHLMEALSWIDSLGLDCRVPLDPDRPDAAAAEELLGQWGYRPSASQVRFLHRGSPPTFPAPPGIVVREVEEFTEGFGDILGRGYELGLPRGWFFDCLPGRDPWRCYLACDAEGRCLAAAAMLVDFKIAHLGFAATVEEERGLGCHTALLRRMIEDAGTHHRRTLLAETTEPLGERDGPSPGARNLLRAGFHQASVRALWRRG